MNCVARIKYAAAEKMFPRETLNRMSRETVKEQSGKRMKKKEKKKEKGFVKCIDCDEEAKIRGRCPKHYQAWRHKHPDEVRHYHKDSSTDIVLDELKKDNNKLKKKDEESKNIIGAKVYDIRLRAHRNENLERYDLLRDTVIAAKQELRSMQAQVFYFLREGLEKWKKEKDL